MKKYKKLAPIVKWVGGKRQLIDQILPHFPSEYDRYIEPFIGGGAMCFEVQPNNAIINDYNHELINTYLLVRDKPNELLNKLKEHEKSNCADYFYTIREWDRLPNYDRKSKINKAARLIYLNKTCYNGLFRVNQAGQFNTPYGKYKNPNIVNELGVLELSKYFNENDIDIRCGDYKDVLKDVKKGDFIYLDPPYMPISTTSSFTGYTGNGFGYNMQIELKEQCDILRDKNIPFVQSNSDCKEIRELYKDYKIVEVRAKRSINSKSSGRGEINEVLIVYDGK